MSDAGRALARLLGASAGAPVTLPDGPVADAFRRALDALLPPGPPLGLALAGPGRPTVMTDITLVPQHPQTGERWPLPGSPEAVPLAWDIWAYLAFHQDQRPVPGRIPDEAHEEDSVTLTPFGPFQPDGSVFRRALARMPEVRPPWLREIYDRVSDNPCAPPF